MLRFSARQRGQGLVEYALILVLVAIVVIAGLSLLGSGVNNVFRNVWITLRSVSGGGSPTDLVVSSLSITSVDWQPNSPDTRRNVVVRWSASCQNGLGEAVACSVTVLCSIAGAVPNSTPACSFTVAPIGETISVQVTGASAAGLTWNGSAPSATSAVP